MRTASGRTASPSMPPLPGRESVDLSGSWVAKGVNGDAEYFQLLSCDRLPPSNGVLTVEVVEARGLLPSIKKGTTSNPKIKVCLGAQFRKTEVLKKTLKPQFNHQERFELVNCCQDTLASELLVSNSTFELVIEASSEEQSSGMFSLGYGDTHQIGSRRLNLASKEHFPQLHSQHVSEWSGTVDQWFLLHDPTNEVSNKIAKHALRQRQQQKQE